MQPKCFADFLKLPQARLSVFKKIRVPDVRMRRSALLSRPHPLSFRRALQKPDGDQKHRSRHHGKFLEPETGRLLTEDNARRLREGLFGQDVSRAAIEEPYGTELDAQFFPLSVLLKTPR